MKHQATNKVETNRVAKKVHGMKTHVSGLRSDQLLRSKGGIGNHQILRRSYRSIHPKLAISTPNDKYEREADRLADMVVGTSNYINLQQVPDSGEASVQRQTAISSIPESENIPDCVRSINSSGRGRSLDKSSREYFEPHFGDLSHVKVHTGNVADNLLNSLNALAFTIGENIFVGKGHYSFETNSGKKLLAHELVHVSNGDGSTIYCKRRKSKPIDSEQSEHFDIDEEKSYLNYLVKKTIENLDDLSEHKTLLGAYGEAKKIGFVKDFAIALRERPHPYYKNYLIYFLSALEKYGSKQTASIVTVEIAEEGVLPSAEKHERSEVFVELSEAEKLLVNNAIVYILEYVNQVWEEDQGVIKNRMDGAALARKLVWNMKLDSRLIIATLSKLKEQNEELYDAAMFQGYTLRYLQENGITGLLEFSAAKEGLVSAFIRGEIEFSEISEVEGRDFEGFENISVIGGFIHGTLQGVRDSFVTNIEMITSLFSKEFWSNLSKAFEEVLVPLLFDKEFQYMVGISLAHGLEREELRMKTASPYEYGRTIGYYFGFALFEIALLFVGLGWVLKLLQLPTKGLLFLFKNFPRLASLAQKLAKLAKPLILAKNVIKEAVQVFLKKLVVRAERLRTLLSKISITSAGRIDYARRMLSKADDFELLVKQAIKAGDVQTAQKYLNEMNAVLDEFEDFVKLGGKRTGKLTGEIDKPISRPSLSYVEDKLELRTHRTPEKSKVPELGETKTPKSRARKRPSEEKAWELTINGQNRSMPFEDWVIQSENAIIDKRLALGGEVRKPPSLLGKGEGPVGEIPVRAQSKLSYRLNWGRTRVELDDGTVIFDKFFRSTKTKHNELQGIEELLESGIEWSHVRKVWFYTERGTCSACATSLLELEARLPEGVFIEVADTYGIVNWL